MDAAKIGSFLGAAALAVIPTAGGLYAYGSAKDRGNSTGAAAIIGGGTMTGLGIAVALANYYILGLDDVTSQLEKVISGGGGGSTSGLGLVNVQKRRLGLISAQRRPSLGLVNVQKQRMGTCVGCPPMF